ncbi:DNase I-like protein [Amylostereum chailletii]|nr:DNase I-like protein [Amylostereum chailletii]
MTRLPPPPTRTIALGDKLPPARRQASTSSDESGDDDDPKSKLADSMPDVSQASRREPTLNCHPFTTTQMQITAHTSVVCAAGHIFLASSHHHVKIYDLSVSESPLFVLGAREVGLVKELKVTSMEFRPARAREDQGRYAWLGTKDGHLFEVDVQSGAVVGTRLAVHSHAVTHILRHGMSMVTLDENGKALVFVCEAGMGDTYFLAHVQPRVARISDKQEFARIFAGKLWTSARDPVAAGAGGGASRGPIIRVYDIFSPGSMGRSVLPIEHVGTVTSGTIIPTDPHRVYIGHEGGFVSIWDAITQDGIPQCVEVIKVSTSDVLTMEGVHDRLWVGGRQGTIATYDVAPRPWVLTTQWNAHNGLPVPKVWVDPFSIDKLGKLAVISVGRDERVKTWDGMLGTEWIDVEVLKREPSFASFRDVKILIMSWNMDAAKPDQLVGTPENVNLLKDVLTSVDSPDLIVFGFQEMIDLESRKMAAKTMLLGGKKKGGSGLEVSEKVTGQYKRWHDKLVTAVRLAMPPEEPYVIIQTENLVGLFMLVLVKASERVMLRDISITSVKRGMGGRYGNKGGIVARMVIDDTSVCFINCHLAAGQHHVRRRNADAGAMLEERTVFKDSEFLTDHLPFVGGGDGSMVLDHEIVFINGDMNYRIDQRRDTVVNAIKAGEYQSLIMHDQLTKEMKFNRAFRLRPFREGPLTFAPTYKYDRRSDEFDTSEKRRTPAWCDRVLWRSRVPSRVEQLDYRRYEANVSDHRPISAAFRLTAKSIQHDARAAVVADVQGTWVRQEKALLASIRAFYVEQMVL